MNKVLAFLLGVWILSSCSSSSDGSTEKAVAQTVADSIYRPAYHFSSAKNWMGAPISMVFHNNEYHLFYEYNSAGTNANSNSWGHAVSPDMMQWKELSYVSELSKGGQGSIVSDPLNTSRLGQNILLAVTSRDDELNLSYSTNNGQKWIEYNENPVLAFPGTPKVTWVDDRWIMTVTQESEITFFSSDDMISWSQESQLALSTSPYSAELFTISNTWGLLLNSNNGVDLMLGAFDGSTFSPSASPSPFDFGFDNAAGTVMKTQDRSVFIGQMNNNKYLNSSPTKTWKSTLTIPRELTIDENGQLKSFPVQEISLSLAAKRRGKLDLLKSSASNWYSFTSVSSVQEVEITISNEGSEKLTLKYDQSAFTLDRSKSGLTEFNDFSGMITTEYANIGDTIQFDLFIDRSSVEIFINEGQVQFSSLVYPRNSYKSVSLIVDGELRNIPAILYDVEVIMYPPPH